MKKANKKTKLIAYIDEYGGAKLFAEALGVTPGCVYHWITGRRTPSIESIRAISDLTRGELSFEEILS